LGAGLRLIFCCAFRQRIRRSAEDTPPATYLIVENPNLLQRLPDYEVGDKAVLAFRLKRIRVNKKMSRFAQTPAAVLRRDFLHDCSAKIWKVKEMNARITAQQQKAYRTARKRLSGHLLGNFEDIANWRNRTQPCAEGYATWSCFATRVCRVERDNFT